MEWRISCLSAMEVTLVYIAIKIWVFGADGSRGPRGVFSAVSTDVRT